MERTVNYHEKQIRILARNWGKRTPKHLLHGEGKLTSKDFMAIIRFAVDI